MTRSLEYKRVALGSYSAMVTCSDCQAELDEDAVFCGACGRKLRTRRALTGTVIDGRFVLDQRIAAGGFATIYRARHRVSGAHVALKVLHGDLASDKNLSERFRREAAALAQLRDMHTITMYEFGETEDGTLFIAMELLTGKSLSDELAERGTLPWRRVVEIARGVCSSLSEAHRLGIIHRDIKPANIHLEHRARGEIVKLFDFGVAKVPGGHGIAEGVQLTRAGQSIGTIDYMAPEQLLGDGCDGRTDLYSLGVVMYELLIGHRPFADATGPASLVTALVTQTPVTPTALGMKLPPELERTLLRCLEREPSARFKSVDELAWALGQIMDRYPETPPAPAPVAPPRVPSPVIPPASRTPSPRSPVFAAAPTLVQPIEEEVTAVDHAPPKPAPLPPLEPIVRFAPRRIAEGSGLEGLFAQGSTVGPSPMAASIWLLVLLTRDARVVQAVARLL
jgi:serine/threonine protein kinase